MDRCAPVLAAGAGGPNQTRRLLLCQRPGVECGHRRTGAAGAGVLAADRRVARRDQHPGHATRAATDAAGRFAIAGIAPGKYRLSAERNGFLTTQYGSRGPNKAGTLLTLEPGQKSSDLAMRLTPHGVIAGRVLDEEGEPVSQRERAGIAAAVYAGPETDGADGWSDHQRSGRIPRLRPAAGTLLRERRTRVRIRCAPQTDDEYVTTFFPRTTDAAAAAPIDVAPGAQLRNIDIPLAKMHTVTVTRTRGQRDPSAAAERARSDRIST